MYQSAELKRAEIQKEKKTDLSKVTEQKIWSV